MAFTLSGTDIAAPNTLEESNNTQYAQQRTLSGSVGRDFFGSNKRVWKLTYRNKPKAKYDTIKTIYDAYLAAGSGVSWVSTETNYSISSTTVHVDLQTRGFKVGGEDYLSDFDLILSEA